MVGANMRGRGKRVWGLDTPVGEQVRAAGRYAFVAEDIHLFGFSFLRSAPFFFASQVWT